MADLDDSADVFPAVRLLAETDPVLGGTPNPETGAGMDNIPHLQLAQRTKWLKTRVDALISSAAGLASTAAAGLVQLVDSVSSTATNRAATPNSVRIANENANSRVPNTRTITGGGLATGGGTLDANRTITVPKASEATAVAGTADDQAVTPLGVKAAINSAVSQLPATVSPSRMIGTSGIATGGGDLSANRTITVAKATEAQAKAGTLDDRAVTPLGLAAALNARTPGLGQSWSNVASSRVVGTSYQNTTEAPIVAVISASGVTNAVQVSANGSSWVSIPAGHGGTHTIIVPPGHYYRVPSGGEINAWIELR